MSKYTTEVRYICEVAAGLDESVGFDNIEDVLEKSHSKIFSFRYPIFDEAYRPVLEKKILRHYYTREIGLETVGLWKHHLSMVMNEIMPYYNKLYESELLEFDPFKDADYYKKNDGTQTGDNTRDTTTHNISDTGTDGNSSEQHSDRGWNFFSDTPQGNIYDFPGELHSQGGSNMTYLTNATRTLNDGDSSEQHHDTTISESNGTGNETGKFKTVDDYLDHVWGKFPGKSYSKMLQEYRDTFLNIDMMVIKDLAPLFMNLW